jgi:hypothetical protein
VFNGAGENLVVERRGEGGRGVVYILRYCYQDCQIGWVVLGDAHICSRGKARRVSMARRGAGMQAALVVRGIQRDEAGRGLTILGNRRRVRTRYSCRASRLLEPAEELGLAEELS